MIYCEGYGFIHRLLLFMVQKLIDMVHFFSFSFIENSPDDKVDNRKLWDELEIEGPVEGEPTSQSCQWNKASQHEEEMGQSRTEQAPVTAE